MLGWIMPLPFAMPPMRQTSRIKDTATSLGRKVSVVANNFSSGCSHLPERLFEQFNAFESDQAEPRRPDRHRWSQPEHPPPEWKRLSGDGAFCWRLPYRPARRCLQCRCCKEPPAPCHYKMFFVDQKRRAFDLILGVKMAAALRGTSQTMSARSSLFVFANAAVNAEAK